MNDEMLKPTAEFRRSLEETILAEVRAHRRGTTRAQWQRRMRMAAVIAIAAATGAGATVAAAQVRENRERDLLLAAQQSELELAKARVQLANANAAEVRRKFDVGMVTSQSLAAAESDVRAMELKLARVELNIDEMKVSAAPARDELWAPLVGKRDFVVERLRLDLANGERALAQAEEIVARAQQTNLAGASDGIALMHGRADLTTREAELKLVLAKLDLRHRYLREKVPVPEVERELKLLELNSALKKAEASYKVATGMFARMSQRRGASEPSRVDLMRAELAVSERGTELDEIRRQISVLQRRD